MSTYTTRRMRHARKLAIRNGLTKNPYRLYKTARNTCGGSAAGLLGGIGGVIAFNIMTTPGVGASLWLSWLVSLSAIGITAGILASIIMLMYIFGERNWGEIGAQRALLRYRHRSRLPLYELRGVPGVEAAKHRADLTAIYRQLADSKGDEFAAIRAHIRETEAIIAGVEEMQALSASRQTSAAGS